MRESDLHSLKSDTLLNNYIIIRVLGSGGFGITYLARDRGLDTLVVIKEYFPNEIAVRHSDKTIMAKTSSGHDFRKGLKRFKEEAQTLAKFNHPSIVKILGYFEENNTAYFVMEYEEGMDLAQYLKQAGSPVSQEDILEIMMPILEGLKEVHRHNYLHRDIKPGNILLRKNNSPVLIDFGATRVAVNDEQSKSVTSMLTEGYAPSEQYITDLKRQGPFTDIYAIGAVMYKMITIQTPVSSLTRSFQTQQDEEDPLKKLTSMNLKEYDGYFLRAIDKALENKPKERQQSVEELQADLIEKMTSKDNKNETKQPSSKNNNSSIANWILSVFALMVLFGGARAIYIQQQQLKLEKSKTIRIGNLTWQDEPINETKILDWKKAIAYCEDLTLGEYSDWRLPDKNTLEELYEHKSKLKYVSSDYYWSSSTYVSGSKRAWVVDFEDGSAYNSNKRNEYYVRCVRGRQ